MVKKPRKSNQPIHTSAEAATIPFSRFEIGAYLVFQFLAIYMELGVPFMITALLYAMFRNTSTRDEGDVSAYSVFNKNARRIGGSLTSEQIDGEITRKMY